MIGISCCPVWEKTSPFHPVSQLVEHRFTGALQAIKELADHETSSDNIQAMIDDNRESLRDHLDDRVITEGTPGEIKSIQQEIGRMQALQELCTSEVSTGLLQRRYNLELKALRKVLRNAPTKNSMWDPEIDRAIAPIERGYLLVDTLGREERRNVNTLHGIDDINPQQTISPMRRNMRPITPFSNRSYPAHIVSPPPSPSAPSGSTHLPITTTQPVRPPSRRGLNALSQPVGRDLSNRPPWRI